MFGWVNAATESLVITNFGLETWHRIKEIAGCDVEDGGFVRHRRYPDESTIALVQAGSQVLGLPAEAILEAFGKHFMEFTRKEGYENLLQCQGSTLKAWLSNLNALHDHLASALPNGMVPPVFWCEEAEENDGSILLHYYSERGSLLVPVVVGVVHEVARFHFDLKITMNELQKQGEKGSNFTTWSICAADPADTYKVMCDESTSEEVVADNPASLTPEQAPVAAPESRAQKVLCPFTRMIFRKSNKPLKKPKIFEEKPSPSTSSDIVISSSNMQDIFPYHLVVDRSFQILQVGKLLPHLIMGLERSTTGAKVGELLTIVRPPLCTWEWSSIGKLRHQTFFVSSTSGPTENAIFKGTFKELDATRILIILSPDVKNMQELNHVGLTLSDLPLHTFQRDAVLLGEHISSEVQSYHALEQLSRRLEAETSISKTLLNSMLPSSVVELLRAGKWVPPKFYDSVTILFADIVGFTSLCDQIKSWRVIGLLNRLFKIMDYVAAQFGVYKIETVGDCYVCCCGLPQLDEDHAAKVASFALAVQSVLHHVTSPVDGQPLELRIGIHSGSCTAGVIGNLAPRYCLFGDTVNTTARHESTGLPGKVQCSASTYELIKDRFVLEKRGLVEMKGKGEQLTYWLQAPKGEVPGLSNWPHMEEMNKNVAEELMQVRTKQTYFKAESRILRRDYCMSETGSSGCDSSMEDETDNYFI